MSLDSHEGPVWEVALIDPDGYVAAQYRHRPGHRLFPHIGLGYLAASLERNRDRVHILDTGVATRSQIQRFLSHPYHLVGITTTSFTFRQALAVAQAVKQRYPAVPVVLGGPHASIDPQSCLVRGVVDFAVRGEGEEALVDLIEVLKRYPRPNVEILQQIPGLIFTDDGKIKTNPAAARLKVLDQWPYPAWHLFPMRRYRQHPIVTSRGCPMDCSFCAVRTIWGREWIRREAEHVVAEMAWLQEKWGRKTIHINDDNLTMNPQHAERFCDEIFRRRLKVYWVAQGVRADGVETGLLKKMRRAGCERVSLGIESARASVLAAIGKRETPDDMARAIRLCRQAGIQVLGMFMVGNPGDSVESIRESIRFAQSTKIDLPAFYMALPYPGTRLWDYVKQSGRFLKPDYLSFNHLSKEPVFETDDFTAQARSQAYQEAARFCRRRWLSYHLLFWWPGRLLRRNAHEIRHELGLWIKLLFFPFWIWKRFRRGWGTGGIQ